jgi:hypothetical protein
MVCPASVRLVLVQVADSSDDTVQNTNKTARIRFMYVRKVYPLV